MFDSRTYLLMDKWGYDKDIMRRKETGYEYIIKNVNPYRSILETNYILESCN